MSDNVEKDLGCSFCKKDVSQVKKLLAGDNVYICDECVERSLYVILDGKYNKVIQITPVFDKEEQRENRAK